MYFGSIGCFFVWNYNKHGSIYEKYKECNLISYRIGNEMIYTYNISFIINLGKATADEVVQIVMHIGKTMKDKYKFEMRSNSICTFNNIDYF